MEIWEGGKNPLGDSKVASPLHFPCYVSSYLPRKNKAAILPMTKCVHSKCISGKK